MESSETPPTLAVKLDRLFKATHPQGKGEVTYREVARAIEAQGTGTTISPSYLYALRVGQKDNPTKRHLEALAEFFGVSVAYFFDDDVARRIDAQLDLLAALRDSQVEHIAMRAGSLSPDMLNVITAMVDAAAEQAAQSAAEPADPGSRPPDEP